MYESTHTEVLRRLIDCCGIPRRPACHVGHGHSGSKLDAHELRLDSSRGIGDKFDAPQSGGPAPLG
jgi:hypothetical protein